MVMRRSPPLPSPAWERGKPGTGNLKLFPGLIMLRILVVEDNPLVAKFYRLALERAGGFQVTFNEDVEAILAQVASSAFDALGLDVSFPQCPFQGTSVDG